MSKVKIHVDKYKRSDGTPVRDYSKSIDKSKLINPEGFRNDESNEDFNVPNKPYLKKENLENNLRQETITIGEIDKTFRIIYVKNKINSYIGMNYYASRKLGIPFNYPENTILILDGMERGRTFRTIYHEIIEYYLMGTLKLSYHDAHIISNRYEDNPKQFWRDLDKGNVMFKKQIEESEEETRLFNLEETKENISDLLAKEKIKEKPEFSFD